MLTDIWNGYRFRFIGDHYNNRPLAWTRECKCVCVRVFCVRNRRALYRSHIACSFLTVNQDTKNVYINNGRAVIILEAAEYFFFMRFFFSKKRGSLCVKKDSRWVLCFCWICFTHTTEGAMIKPSRRYFLKYIFSKCYILSLAHESPLESPSIPVRNIINISRY